jgi:predicted nucleic acid-binding protein
MIVVDASAAFDAVVGRDPLDAIASRLAEEDELLAPHLIDIEVLHALRGSVLRDELGIDRASDARDDFADLALSRYPHEPFIDRIWDLRDVLSAYDASYLALAEAISIPLLTCDRGLASVAERTVEVELFPPSG